MWLDEAMSHPGHSVLIHCFAGAHRGGAVTIAYLMHACRLQLSDALATVKGVRPIVDPQELLLELLERLDIHMCREDAE